MDNIAVTTNSENEENAQSKQLLPVQSAHLITASHQNDLQVAQYESNLVLSRSPSGIIQSNYRDERRPSRGLFYEYVPTFNCPHFVVVVIFAVIFVPFG